MIVEDDERGVTSATYKDWPSAAAASRNCCATWASRPAIGC